MSNYPTGLDSFATNRADGTAMATIQAGDHNAYAAAINAIEAELGAAPSASYATVLLRLDALTSQVPFTSQAGTTYTLALTDAGTVVEMTAATPVALTVPTNASIAFPLHSIVMILQRGAGQVTVGGAGVTFLSPGNKLKTSVLYSTICLRKRATNEWVLSGDLGA